jgi:short-subunit dehydrogenase
MSTQKKPNPFCFSGANSPREFMNRIAVVVITGGSSGIGSALIKAIIDISPEIVVCNLSRKKPEIFLGNAGQHHAVDLQNASELSLAAGWVEAQIASAPPGEILLINNSGFGDYGPFVESDRVKQLNMIDLNIRAVVDLTAHLLPALKERGGAVVNVASTAAFQSTPQMATYGATKAFVLSWSLALNEELRGTNLRALAVCPGPTRSNFFKAAGFETPPMQKGGINAWFDMTAAEVAALTLRALARNKALVVTGWKNQGIALLHRFVSKVTCARIAGSAMRKLRLEQFRSNTSKK